MVEPRAKPKKVFEFVREFPASRGSCPAYQHNPQLLTFGGFQESGAFKDTPKRNPILQKQEFPAFPSLVVL